jgi:hypothetical protein
MLGGVAPWRTPLHNRRNELGRKKRSVEIMVGVGVKEEGRCVREEGRCVKEEDTQYIAAVRMGRSAVKKGVP